MTTLRDQPDAQTLIRYALAGLPMLEAGSGVPDPRDAPQLRATLDAFAREGEAFSIPDSIPDFPVETLPRFEAIATRTGLSVDRVILGSICLGGTELHRRAKDLAAWGDLDEI